MLPIKPGNHQIELVLLSFEGPDQYSQAGGLGARVTNLSYALAEMGYQVHLFFVGDPQMPGYEEACSGRLHLYRWCQWISRYHLNGVYDGEEDKLNDYTTSVPDFIVEHIAKPVIGHRRHLVVLAEDWQTTEALMALSDRLYEANLRKSCVLLWNANNTTGFERVNWPRLSFISTITTVSRYMKHIMRAYGIDPLVIPNGIPGSLLSAVDPEIVLKIQNAIQQQSNIFLLKVARFDPAKCWWMAIEAAARLKFSGHPIRFVIRGGLEAHGGEVLQYAYQLGLSIQDVNGSPKDGREVASLIRESGPADIYNLRFFMSQAILRPFYSAADVILANSKHEPFGLVGLEAMAAGGIVFTGPTGETYSANGVGAIALDTETAEEIMLQTLHLKQNPDRVNEIRTAARKVAAQFTWDKVIMVLLEKIQFAALQQETKPFMASPSHIVRFYYQKVKNNKLQLASRYRQDEKCPIPQPGRIERSIFGFYGVLNKATSLRKS